MEFVELQVENPFFIGFDVRSRVVDYKNVDICVSLLIDCNLTFFIKEAIKGYIPLCG